MLMLILILWCWHQGCESLVWPLQQPAVSSCQHWRTCVLFYHSSEACISPLIGPRQCCCCACSSSPSAALKCSTFTVFLSEGSQGISDSAAAFSYWDQPTVCSLPQQLINDSGEDAHVWECEWDEFLAQIRSSIWHTHRHRVKYNPAPASVLIQSQLHVVTVPISVDWLCWWLQKNTGSFLKHTMLPLLTLRESLVDHAGRQHTWEYREWVDKIAL